VERSETLGARKPPVSSPGKGDGRSARTLRSNAASAAPSGAGIHPSSVSPGFREWPLSLAPPWA